MDLYSSNPCCLTLNYLSIFLLFKARKYEGRNCSAFYLGAARASDPESSFEVITPEPLFGAEAPNGEVEDPFIWIDKKGLYHMVAKDMRGDVGGSEADGVELISSNGLDWKFLQNTYTRGGLALRERPFILFDDNGEPLALYTAVADGFPYSDPDAQTWNAVCRYEKQGD